MNFSNKSLLKRLTLVSLIFLSIPLIIYGLWTHAFKLGTTQVERVDIFYSYFPELLQGRYVLAYISIAFCLLTIILSSISLKLSGIFWKTLNIIILIINSLLLLLNLFQLM